MSKFLGPIHFWVYHKILLQEAIITEIIALNGDQADPLQVELDHRYGVSETRPLETVIDPGNIHGWLQTNVTRAEYKLAAAITSLLDQNPGGYPQIEAIFRAKGQALSQPNLTPATAYKLLSDSLLDGMPCDHANVLMKEDDDQVVWQRNSCVHSPYWQAVGGDIAVYYALREALIEGLLAGTGLVYQKRDTLTSIIRRSNQ